MAETGMGMGTATGKETGAVRGTGLGTGKSMHTVTVTSIGNKRVSVTGMITGICLLVHEP